MQVEAAIKSHESKGDDLHFSFCGTKKQHISIQSRCWPHHEFYCYLHSMRRDLILEYLHEWMDATMSHLEMKELIDNRHHGRMISLYVRFLARMSKTTERWLEHKKMVETWYEERIAILRKKDYDFIDREKELCGCSLKGLGITFTIDRFSTCGVGRKHRKRAWR